MLSEIQFMRKVRGYEYLVQLFEVYCSEESDDGNMELSIVMNYAPYGSISRYLRNKKELIKEDEMLVIMS